MCLRCIWRCPQCLCQASKENNNPKLKKGTTLAAWLHLVTPVICLLSTFVERESERERARASKRFELLHLSASHWQVVYLNMENPLFLPSQGAAVGSYDNWMLLCFFIPSNVAASVVMQLLGISAVRGTFVLLFLLFGHLQFVFAWLKKLKTLSNSVPVLRYQSRLAKCPVRISLAW